LGQENFTRSHVPSIKGQGIIASASEDGLARWISTDDVGAVAFRALTDTSLKNTDHICLGPELLSHDDVGFLSMQSGLGVSY
jgi:festuclavine dehydrogenase